jgi:S-adenosylmethionine-dependent methyltransferase
LANALALDRHALRRRAYRFNLSLKPRQTSRFRTLSPEKSRALADFTRCHYANVSDEGEINAALEEALSEDRYANVPWLDAALPLNGARVLEIGSGTGESTLALAEQGAIVTGLDVDDNALAVGRERLKAYGLEAELLVANAQDVAQVLPGRTFDAVIFFASLEHMRLDERLIAMRATWDMLRPGGIWCVIEAPNRIWYWDGHTSMDNFYNWLPDEMAARWAHRASSKAFADAFPKEAPFDATLLARWGRGVSYHDFDLALGDSRALDIVSNKSDFLRRSNPFFLAHSLVSKARRYERFLESIAPGVNPGFLKQYLDLIIRK